MAVTHSPDSDSVDPSGSVFSGDRIDIQTQEILMRGQVRDGLYHFFVDSVDSSPSAYTTDVHDRSTGDDIFTLWHKRLGHPSFNTVKAVLENCRIVTNKNPLNTVCVACQQGKSHKLPFSSSHTKYVDLFELVVSDLWGPASVTCEGNLYYVSLVDMYSRFTWVYLLKRKSQAVDCFVQFQQMVHTQFGKRIKKFQSDWGSEFRAFAPILARHGILHRISCPHTSEQNGVAERKHRRIVETGLILLAQANLPMVYWGYAFCSAVHLINRLPTPVLKGMTPYQRLLGSIPTYDHLLRFLFTESGSLSAQPPTCTSSFVPVIRPTRSQQHSGLASLRATTCESPSFDSSATCSPVNPSPVDTMPTLRTSLQQTLSAPIVTLHVPSLAADPPATTSNSHAMVTWSKARIFKPKALSVDTVDFEPTFVEEALANPAWKIAVQAEYDALIANSTWELCPLPPGRKVIGCKWLFKVKKNPDGTIERRKARLVTKGCSQVPGCDFKETFSPVVKPTTIQLIFSIAVSRGWCLRQVDVNNAFLNGDLSDEVFMQQPPGYVQFGPNGEKLVCRLTKALYDASLFVKVSSDFSLYILVYVDDIVITGSSADEIDCFVQQLHNKFALKDMGNLHYFLGIEVSRSSSGTLHLCQQKYIHELLDRSSMANAKSVHTPMVSSSLLLKDEGERLSDPTEYRSLAGALQYIVLTRPDIAYAVNRICQFMHAPTKIHMMALKRILRYLRGTLSHGLVIRSSDRLSLVGYADANWGLDFDDQAEYRSLAAATNDIAWLVSLLTELKLCSVDLPTVWCDNSSAVAVAANPVLHSKFKHVELDLFFVREKVASEDLVVGEVPACDQVADILTKPLSVALFTRFRHLLRVLPLEEAG
ncbi:hypothetical protein CXB51_015700 [Gossypium anomalum]|uniref:Integrase catalytic domain-containing protein n=1 Tax=Gossypium anomalum TaxID=47600 RepID=A0A8J5YSS6_9ROSI|nr:hypothetical protein CXB51_015700 [Gossypium anomalum]